jgi:hypothetical protein
MIKEGLFDVADSKGNDELEGLSDEELFEKVDVSMNKGDLENYHSWLLKVSTRFEPLYFTEELARNRGITEFCNHPDAVIEIDTKDAPPVNIRQYPICHRLSLWQFENFGHYPDTTSQGKY